MDKLMETFAGPWPCLVGHGCYTVIHIVPVLILYPVYARPPGLCHSASCAIYIGMLYIFQESEHLKRFNLTWELHDKHLFRSIIYTDPVVQNSLPMLVTQLRSVLSSSENSDLRVLMM